MYKIMNKLNGIEGEIEGQSHSIPRFQNFSSFQSKFDFAFKFFIPNGI